jgi:MFS family permease
VTAIPLLLFIVKTKPADIGLSPDGIIETNDMAETEKKPTPTRRGISLKVTLTTLAFWLIAFSLIFNHTHLGIMQSVFPYLTDQGFSVGLVSIVNSLLFIVICISMFLFGMLSDLIAPKFAAALGLACMAIGVFLLIMVNPSSSFPFFIFFAIGMGLGVGSWMPSMSLLISTTFGSASYGFIFGLLSIFIYAGGAIGPLIAGYSFDIQNSYRWGFIIILILIVAAIPLVLAVPRKMSRITS